MPKIIKDIENKIFEKSKEMFSHKGYNNTDMKAIAKSCGIAVGTLYNYYPNKRTIYIDVFLKSWNKTIKKLEKIETKEDREKELREIMRVFYCDVEDRNGLGNDLRELCGKGDDKFDEIVKKLFSNVIDVTIKRFELKDEFKEKENIEEKIILIWFVGLCAIRSDFNDSKDDNIEFLYNTIKNYFNL